MAIQKKRILTGVEEATKAEREAARLRMKEEMQGGGVTETVPKAKDKSKAKQIKELRPKQVSIHFTEEEKFAMEDARTLAKRMGMTDATVEDLVHGLVVVGLRCIENDKDLLKRIIQEDDNLIIS